MDALTGVRGTWMRAAAIPVGAQASAVWPCTSHHRKMVSRRKLYPVPAEAWSRKRAGALLSAIFPVISL